MVVDSKTYKCKEDFWEDSSLESRKAKVRDMKSIAPDKVAVWLDFKSCESLKRVITKHKYIVGGDLTLSVFMAHIRKRAKLGSESALFAMVNNGCPPMTFTFAQIAETNKHEDGFVYLTIKEENTFGKT